MVMGDVVVEADVAPWDRTADELKNVDYPHGSAVRAG
jgi:hypothetical protein